MAKEKPIFIDLVSESQEVDIVTTEEYDESELIPKESKYNPLSTRKILRSKVKENQKEEKEEVQQIWITKNEPINVFQGSTVKELGNATIIEEEEQRNQIVIRNNDNNQNNRLSQHDLMVVCRYLDGQDIINIEKSNKEYRGMLEMFHYNPFPISTKRQRKLLPNLQEWRIYFQNTSSVKQDFKAIQIKDKPITSIIMDYPVGVVAGTNFIAEHPEIPCKEQYEERIVLNPLTNTKENKKCINKILNPNTIQISEPVHCNTALKILDISNTKVRYLPDRSFVGFTSLTVVKLPDTIQSLGSQCFYGCECLSKINLPTTLTKIYNECFLSCSRLFSIKLPPYLEEIGYGSFRDTGLLDISIPPLIKTLPGQCFHSCHILDLELPSQLKEIHEECFRNCFNLRYINLPTTVTSIGKSAFLDCTRLTSMVLPDEIKVLESYTFKNCPLRTVQFPSNLTEIKTECFATSYLSHILVLPQTDCIILHENWKRGRVLPPYKEK